MTVELPDPPYPSDVRARGWTFQLDVERIENSDTWLLASPDLRPWLLMVWMRAWTQTPCGSLPVADELIAARIGMPADSFRAVRNTLLRGWYRASDGRLYHPVVTELVEAMRDSRKSEREKKARQRAAKASSPDVPRETLGNLDGLHEEPHRTPEGVPGASTGSPATGPETEPETGPGTGTGQKRASRKRAAAASQLVPFEALVADGVEEQHAKDWLAIRRAKNVPLTPTAWADTKAQAEQAGMSIGEAIHHAVVSGWAGFRKKWLDEAANGARQRSTGAVTSAATREANTAARNAEARRLLGFEQLPAGEVINAEE